MRSVMRLATCFVPVCVYLPWQGPVQSPSVESLKSSASSGPIRRLGVVLLSDSFVHTGLFDGVSSDPTWWHSCIERHQNTLKLRTISLSISVSNHLVPHTVGRTSIVIGVIPTALLTWRICVRSKAEIPQWCFCYALILIGRSINKHVFSMSETRFRSFDRTWGLGDFWD